MIQSKKQFHTYLLPVFIVLMLISANRIIFGQTGKQENPDMWYYVKSNVTMVVYGDNNAIETKNMGSEEIWIKENEVADVSSQDVTYLNTLTNQLVIVDLRTRTYMTTSIPLKLEDIFTAERLAARQKEINTGAVKKLKNPREILGIKCNCYQVTMKRSPDAKANILMVWASEKVPFDFKLFDRLLEYKRIIYNRDEKLRKELRKIKGFQLRIENPGIVDGKKVNYISEVVEISKKTPPYKTIEDLLKSEGFTKTVKLSK